MSKPYNISGNMKNKTLLRKTRMLDRYFSKLSENNSVIEQMITEFPILKDKPETVYEAKLPQNTLYRFWDNVRSGNDTIREIENIVRTTPEITLPVGFEQHGAKGWCSNWPLTKHH